MRLIKLKIKNIASLKGEHVIDFAFIQQQAPLFAITGETGAGKSTMLNSIGLALYGKVYKSNVTQNDLVTLGEKEGQIELIFQSKGKNYLAFWKARIRKQNGELYSTPQTPQRELYNLEGQDFSDPKSILLTRTEELLNLDFDQFCKCIILNQGEFARFLSSSFSERKEILEKMYPGELLDSLSAQLKKEKDELEKQISEIDIELHTLKGDGPQGEELVIQKNSLETEYKKHEDWLKTLESMDYHFTSLNSYHDKFLETQSKINNLKQSLSKDTSLLNEILDLSQKANEDFLAAQKDQEKHLPRLQDLLKSEEALKMTSEQMEEINKRVAKLTETKQDLQNKRRQLHDKLSFWERENETHQKSFQLPLDQLKRHSPRFEVIFDLFSKKEFLDQEIASKQERLNLLEIQGKEEAKELKEISEKKSHFESEKQILILVEEKKLNLTKRFEAKQRALIRHEELGLKITEIKKAISEQESKIESFSRELLRLNQDHLPLQTTIKLHQLFSAVEYCLLHPTLEESKACPVCKSTLADDRIQDLRSGLEKTNLIELKLKEEELARLILKRNSEVLHSKETIQNYQSDLLLKDQELTELNIHINQTFDSPEIMEEELKQAQKKVWSQEETLKDELKLSKNILKTRELYSSLKSELGVKTKLSTGYSDELRTLISGFELFSDLKPETITLLKNEARKLSYHLELQSQAERLTQEKAHLDHNLQEAEVIFTSTIQLKSELESKITDLTALLSQSLQGKKASELISEMNQRVKDKAENLGIKERELKAQELKLKDFQSRLYTLDDLIKDVDLHFSKEVHALQELGRVKLPVLSPELVTLTEKLGQLALDLSSHKELFSPLKELIASQKFHFKERTSELKMSFASVRARLEDWEKRQDRIILLGLKTKDLTQILDRKARLYEVLGKDDLRTFVLSLVEENLITQTNDELQKLCQGRYEIVHQSRRMKLTPEFYILDKFRDGGLRKVSTLSGGETFMVSLAMALGLAEMTRGKAEIDTLFIDEGFGTLDQESLEDVLDMLKQIQTRGLMVGIISHVKALTQSLSVNLLVTKRQDGTSQVGVVYN